MPYKNKRALDSEKHQQVTVGELIHDGMWTVSKRAVRLLGLSAREGPSLVFDNDLEELSGHLWVPTWISLVARDFPNTIKNGPGLRAAYTEAVTSKNHRIVLITSELLAANGLAIDRRARRIQELWVASLRAALRKEQRDT